MVYFTGIMRRIFFIGTFIFYYFIIQQLFNEYHQGWGSSLALWLGAQGLADRLGLSYSPATSQICVKVLL